MRSKASEEGKAAVVQSGVSCCCPISSIGRGASDVTDVADLGCAIATVLTVLERHDLRNWLIFLR